MVKYLSTVKYRIKKMGDCKRSGNKHKNFNLAKSSRKNKTKPTSKPGIIKRLLFTKRQCRCKQNAKHFVFCWLVYLINGNC